MDKKDNSCCALGEVANCCKVESIISIDERGQMVLPKELRESAGISAGDKFAVVSLKKENEVCCISLIKTSQLEVLVKNFLGPVAKDILGGK